MYYFMDISNAPSSENVRYIFSCLPDGGVQSFPDVDANLGPERAAYLAWVAEGNTPLPWPPVS